MKTGLLLIKNVIKPLATWVLIPLGSTVGASEDRAIHNKKNWLWGNNIENIKQKNEDNK